MITINKEIQSEIVFMPMEDMVPKDSIFRKIDKYIDFTFIYDEVKHLYSIDNLSLGEKNTWHEKRWKCG